MSMIDRQRRDEALYVGKGTSNVREPTVTNISETVSVELGVVTAEVLCSIIIVPHPKSLFPEDLFQLEQNLLFVISHSHSNAFLQHVKNSKVL
jgi:hypothetical protein